MERLSNALGSQNVRKHWLKQFEFLRIRFGYLISCCLTMLMATTSFHSIQMSWSNTLEKCCGCHLPYTNRVASSMLNTSHLMSKFVLLLLDHGRSRKKRCKFPITWVNA
ncbi:hypothetical protein ANCDUO_21060, partial [Ancylostoma duodenale]